MDQSLSAEFRRLYPKYGRRWRDDLRPGVEISRADGSLDIEPTAM